MKILYIIVIIAVIVIIYILKSKLNDNNNKTIDNSNIDITDEDIEEEVRQNNKVEAIRMYRTLYKVDLLEAKNAIEKMMNEL